MESILPLAIIWAVAFGGLTGWLAAQKGRDPLAWGLLGAFLGFFALLAVGLAPAVEQIRYANGAASYPSKLTRGDVVRSAFSPTCRICGEPAVGTNDLCEEHRAKEMERKAPASKPHWPD